MHRMLFFCLLLNQIVDVLDFLVNSLTLGWEAPGWINPGPYGVRHQHDNPWLLLPTRSVHGAGL